ncbi:MAG: NAD(P)/FAD-dependent oxidoreductase [Rothia sp. (in: high G+C Gram-positive bacteria)]|nr:NAD(P)/FAD-dependent oxidoreductase [Rothia sp. (in: high G+C Gram-positive bacteria)]
MSHIYDAVIIGAGYGGLGQGAQFMQDGISNFLILEKASEVGGVWRENTYPGAACDTQAVIYCFSYFLNLRVSRMYAGQEELQNYLKDLATEFDLNERLRLNTEVTSASWDEEEKLWRVKTGSGEELLTRTLVAAWGQLSEPNIPAFAGTDSFAGERFHSAHWRHDLDLTGKRVASIGNAATAVQYVPEIAKVAQQVTVFQRSANYILPRDQHIFTPEETAEFVENPDSYRKIRQEIHDFREAGFERTRRGTEASAEGVALAREHLEKHITDPVLREKLTPDYDYGCKRILRSDEFYPALTRDNVELVTEGIAEITPQGIKTVDGVEREFDVIIYATGFKSQAFGRSTVITGRNGLTLDERWGDAPEAYLGMTVDHFPNFFMMYGPNTNLNHNSVVSMLEPAQKYVVQAIKHLQDYPDQPLDVREEVINSFNEQLQKTLAGSAFSSDCSSWYKNADGRVINNWGGTVNEFVELTKTLNLEDYGIRE